MIQEKAHGTGQKDVQASIQEAIQKEHEGQCRGCMLPTKRTRGCNTMLIDIVPTPAKLRLDTRGLDAWLLSHKRKAFAEDNQLMPGEIVLLDGLADDLLRHTIRVHICSVPL